MLNTLQDLMLAEHHYDRGSYNDSAFWCRQAMEKAMRTLYIHRKGQYPTLKMTLEQIAGELGAPEDFQKVFSLLEYDSGKDYYEAEGNFLEEARKVVEWAAREIGGKGD